MATTSEYLTQLQTDKQTLVNKLNEKGVEASNSGTFTELIPKLDEIQSGENISEYFSDQYVTKVTIPSNSGLASITPKWFSSVKKMPVLRMPLNVTSLQEFFSSFLGEELDLSNLDLSKVTTLTNMFAGCVFLKRLNLNNTSFDNVYALGSFLNNSPLLEHLTFPNNIGKGYKATINNATACTISLNRETKLTHDSLIDVINKLYDLNLTYDVANGGTLYTQQLIIGNTNLAKLTAEEIAVATNKGWTVS